MARLTRYNHSCVRIDRDGGAIVVDPGGLSEPNAVDGASAILITHEHFDHLDVDAVRTAAAADSALRVYGPASVRAALPELTDQLVEVAPGDEFDAAGAPVRVFGGQHALIHPDIPMIANVGYLIDGVYHPGDSFAVPTAPVDTLLVPASGPWMRLAEAIDFARAVRPRRMVPIHDGLLNDVGQRIADRHLTERVGPFGVDYKRLAPGTSVEI